MILFITNNLGRGGKERQIFELLKHLSKNQQNQYVLLMRRKRIEYPLYEIANLKVLYPKKRHSFFGFVLFLLSEIKEDEPDIVHTWEGAVTLAVILARIISGVHFKLVNGSLQYSRKFRFYTKTFWINKFNAFFSEIVAANSKAGLAAAGFREGGKYLVLPNGFDITQFKSSTLERSTNTILNVSMVASFTAAKDYKTLIKACSRILNEGFEFNVVLVGDGVEKKKIEKIVPSIYKNSFTFTGKLTTEEVLIVLSRTDIGVLLSKKGHSEGMSNAIMEYMFSGIPVIATRTGGNCELIVDGQNGFLVPHEDEEMVASRMRILLSDQGLRKEMGDRSRQSAFQEFGIVNAAAKFAALYESIKT